jgi:hypothetical protein
LLPDKTCLASDTSTLTAAAKPAALRPGRGAQDG